MINYSLNISPKISLLWLNKSSFSQLFFSCFHKLCFHVDINLKWLVIRFTFADELNIPFAKLLLLFTMFMLILRVLFGLERNS